MSMFERMAVWFAAILGLCFAAGSFYLAAAPALRYWPYATTATAQAIMVGAAVLVPAWVVWFFALLGAALLITVLSYRLRDKPSK